ncbi:MAG: DNA polymerase I [candidate division Zixibacteria bacterium]|nr:DNA polymerase I [candidate division Zixibacteria bacterium]
MSEKLILIDGTALAYRSYFAFIRRPLISSKGEITSTAFGFINSIQKLKKQYQPDSMIVAFDLGAPTIRHEIYPEYKSTRIKMPDEMVETLPRLDEISEALELPVFKIEGVEADDIIGTLSVKAAQKGMDVYIYTGDKDFFQLVNDKISIIIPGKGGDDDKVLDAEGVKEKFGVLPECVVDVLGLMGDSSDNIPGVPGIGPKTAIQLINDFGGFDELYQSVDSITKKRIKENLVKFREQAELSRRLVVIDTNIDLDVDWKACRISEPASDKIIPLLNELGFGRLIKDFGGVEDNSEKHDVDYRLVESLEELKKLIATISAKKIFAIDTETSSLVSRKAELAGISLCHDEFSAYYIPVGHSNTEKNLPIDEVCGLINKLCSDKEILKIGQNLKYDIQVLNNYGIKFEGKMFDTMLASYVIEPSSRQHGLDALALKHFNYRTQKITELIGTGKKQILFNDVPVEDAVFYACEDADITFRLYDILSKQLKETELEKLFEEIEMPLVEVLRVIEENGVRVNKAKLKEISVSLGEELKRLTQEIHKHSGYEFNINSPVQLQKVLFEDLGLPMKGKTAKKTGYSTNADVLEELARIHPLPKLLLEFRELTKVKSTYSDALVDLIEPESSRIHTSYNQAVTATGRLSSSDPNLQNIPVRTDLGRQVREAFVPTDENHIFLSADYSQIELRLMAHIAGDETMIKSFKNDEDIHSRTAAEIYNVDIEHVTPEMRRKAKITNFAVIYGVSAYGLSRQVELSVKESAQFIDIYFKRYPYVKEYMDKVVKTVEDVGYVTTLFGRRRYIPDINARNKQIRDFARRAAINTPIQGTAADIIKMAMTEIHNEFIKQDYRTKMVLQVHDELVFDVYLPELDKVKDIVKSGMENITRLKIPIRVDMGTGNNWLEAH